MGYENAILQTGNFGRYQRRIFLLLSLPVISWGFHEMGGVFLQAKPDFRCLLPHESFENASYHLPLDITNPTYPWNNKTENRPKCEKYEPVIPGPYNVSAEDSPSISFMVKCDSFVYDRTQYTRTVITEWNLVCDNAWLRTGGDTLFMLGDFPGVIIFSGLSERYGRKPILLIGLTIQFVCGLLVAFSPAFLAFTILRVIMGTTITGTFMVAYTSAIEMVGTKYRTMVGTSIQLSSVMGNISMAGIAYFIRNWRTLQMVFTIPSLAFLLFSKSVPESARWLLTKGRVQEAKNILRKGSLVNGCELSNAALEDLLEDNSECKPVVEKMSMFDIFKYPNLRKKSLLLSGIWFINSATYYGLYLSTANLGGNVYLNFFIAAGVEVPAHIFVLTTTNRWGGKIILSGSLFFSAITLLLSFFIPNCMGWLTRVLAMIGKFTVTVSYATTYMLTAEQYPTGIRNVGVGTCSSIGRLGAVAAPYINYLFEISAYVPLVILGSSALVAGLSSLFLTDTLNRKLPETIQEAEDLGKNEEDTEELHDNINVVKFSKK